MLSPSMITCSSLASAAEVSSGCRCLNKTVQPWHPCVRLGLPDHRVHSGEELRYGVSELIKVLLVCFARALCQKLPDLPLVACRIDGEGIHTEKCIVLCRSSRQLVTGAAPLSPFGWHFSHFSQRRSLTTDMALQLKDRKVQL